MAPTPDLPPVQRYIQRFAGNVGEPDSLRHIECFRVSGSHPALEPAYWTSAIASNAHLTGLIMDDGTMFISHDCEDFGQLRALASLDNGATPLNAVLRESRCTRFELVTEPGKEGGPPRRLLRIDVGNDRRAPRHNGLGLIASLKASPDIEQDLEVELNLLLANQDGVPLNLPHPDPVYSGPLGAAELNRQLLSLDQY